MVQFSGGCNTIVVFFYYKVYEFSLPDYDFLDYNSRLSIICCLVIVTSAKFYKI